MLKKDQLEQLILLENILEGELYYDKSYRLMYATDASAYREEPLAVARPASNDDIHKIINFANKESIPIIPRAAGTSLAGQVVGNGLVVDISKHLTRILEINEKESWVRVEPGVVLDELNMVLEPKGLFFGPETSTSNRCMMAGMLGNNSCGSHSLIYGSTRDHTISVKAILSDNSEVEFTSLNEDEFEQKCRLNSLEGDIYRNINRILSDPENQKEILKEYPDPTIKRRNTGYAIDLLMESSPFGNSNKDFNFSKLIAGSEGTLAFVTEIKLNLVPTPPPEKALMCVHFKTLQEAFYGNLIALSHNPGAVELMDKTILDLTESNIEQRKNRFFLSDDPAAILIIEFARDTKEEILQIVEKLQSDLEAKELGYHFPLLWGNDIPKVWALRKAGLGVLSTMPGDAKPVAVIEDTAVNPEILPEYMAGFQQLLLKHDLKCVYHAHIGTGELHLRPILNLKDPADVDLFHAIAQDTAKLVKKYKGSLSGEHGDGRLRGQFIPLMVGEKNYKILQEIKQSWDPNNIFNPGKIIGTPDMRTNLRYIPGKESREIETIFSFYNDQGILRATEKCNGSGDCRKSALIGGIMCPSYMVSKDENATTRARANILREFLTNSEKKNPFNHKEIYNVMDLCLSCKGCKSECPSNVDISKYKTEFLQHYYDCNGIPLRTRLIAYITSLNKLGSHFPGIYNFFLKNTFFSAILKGMLGFAKERSIPLIYKTTLRKWAKKNPGELTGRNGLKGEVVLFVDEFTDYNDTEIGIKAIKLLSKLGYTVSLSNNVESGRTFLSKGLLRTAQEKAIKNVRLLNGIIREEKPLIGIEPSGILSFRDEYPELVGEELKEASEQLAKSSFMFDEFLINEFEKGNIDKRVFTSETVNIKLHGHCHQKAMGSIEPTKEMLEIPENYKVEEIKSGCCGMAGSFGYEKEHYDFSMKVGDLVLFPEIRNADQGVLISAPGTSCRHQIKDGTGVTAYHPIEILFDALIENRDI